MDYSDYAGVYDCEYTASQAEVDFFERYARRAGPPALEPGCGSGRVALELARRGVLVVGLEATEAMLELARRGRLTLPPEQQANLELLAGDMTDFSLDRRFGLIYLPFREFMHIVTPQEQLACLTCLRDHLRPDGTLILTHYEADPSAWDGLHRQEENDFTDPVSGHRVRVSCYSRHDRHAQVLYQERYLDSYDAEGMLVGRRCIQVTQRWFSRLEMLHLLARAGFEVEDLFSTFAGDPYHGPGGDLIWVARPVALETRVAALTAELTQIQATLADLPDAEN